jgi:hypothetical protein
VNEPGIQVVKRGARYRFCANVRGRLAWKWFDEPTDGLAWARAVRACPNLARGHLRAWGSPVPRHLQNLCERLDVGQSFLYVVKVGRYVKLGNSTDMASRMDVISCHAPVDPVVLALVPERVCDEAEAAQLWAGQRTRGEWYRYTRELGAWAAGLERQA